MLLGTPTASLPPLFTYTLTGIAQRSPELVARYGYVPDITRPLAPATGGHEAHSLGSFGLTGIIPFGLGATISVTGGVSNERCPTECSGTARFMASAGLDYRLLRAPLGASSEAMRVIIAVSGELGIGSPVAGTTETADVGLPLALSFGRPDETQVIPFVTPSAALVFTGKQVGNATSVLAGRALLGAGVALFNPKSALGANIGFQYVFVDKTELQIGVGLTLGGR